MPVSGKRRRWRVVVPALIVAGCALGLCLGWSRLFPGEVARGVAAYDRGDWTSASTLAGERLKSAANDREAVRLLARSMARLRRDKLARALYGRLGGASEMKAEDLYLMGGVLDRS